MLILVTGGLGFIGSAVIRRAMESTEHRIVNVDKVTYAATESSVAAAIDPARYTHEAVDICDRDALAGDELFVHDA